MNTQESAGVLVTQGTEQNRTEIRLLAAADGKLKLNHKISSIK